MSTAAILPPGELLDRVRLMYEIFSQVIKHPDIYNALSSEKKRELSTGINKAYGQAEAFLVEYLSVIDAEKKGRSVLTQLHADVTVGESDAMFAKSIECKSVTAATKTDVNTQLEKAFRQLGGETGHTPRDGDVRVVEVHINSRDNPWPAPGGAYTRYREPVPIPTLCDFAVKEVTAQLQKALPLTQWLKEQTYQPGQQLSRLGKIGAYINPQQQQQVNPRSTRLVAVTPPAFGQPGSISKVHCVTVKIVFKPPYLISTNFYDVVELAELVLQAYRGPHSQNLIVEVVKYKELHLNVATNAYREEVKMRD
ncbi:MAG TPA: hypothetical protein VHB45_13560 [Alloacidobacterium sp.]|nr:hypothetical protein [Alloacidobacterium sp.]